MSEFHQQQNSDHAQKPLVVLDIHGDDNYGNQERR